MYCTHLIATNLSRKWYTCQNDSFLFAEPGLKWKEDTWITIMATLASLGIGLALGLGFFLAGKVCTEVLEASQTTSFFILFAIVLSYTCFVPFGFEATEEICFWRIMGTRVAFVFLFSLLLSRSIMLATSDLDGLPGHITGSIQLALGSFMMTVEVWDFLSYFQTLCACIIFFFSWLWYYASGS